MNVLDKLLNTATGKRLLAEAEATERADRDSRRKALADQRSKAIAAAERAAPAVAKRRADAVASVRSAEAALRAAQGEYQRIDGEILTDAFRYDRALEAAERGLREVAPACVSELIEACNEGEEHVRRSFSSATASAGYSALATYTNAAEIGAAIEKIRAIREEARALLLVAAPETEIVATCAALRSRLADASQVSAVNTAAAEGVAA